MDLAEPIAEAMSVLHRVERTQGANLDGCDGALASVRKALNQLQSLEVHHPAIEVVMERVAASLSKVHALTRIALGDAPAAPRVRSASVPPPAGQPVPADQASRARPTSR